MAQASVRQPRPVQAPPVMATGKTRVNPTGECRYTATGNKSRGSPLGEPMGGSLEDDSVSSVDTVQRGNSRRDDDPPIADNNSITSQELEDDEWSDDGMDFMELL